MNYLVLAILAYPAVTCIGFGVWMAWNERREDFYRTDVVKASILAAIWPILLLVLIGSAIGGLVFRK